MRIRQFIFILLFVAGAALLGGCSEVDEAMLNDFVTSWVLDNADKVFSHTAFGSSGDPTVDAVLDARSVLGSIEKADKLMDEGRNKRDPAKMDEAIELRPNDISYRAARAALALEQGDMKTYQAHNEAAAQIVAGGEVNGEWALTRNIEEYENVEDRIGSSVSGFSSNAQCRELYLGLSELYSQRGELTGNANDTSMAQGYRNQAEYCAPD